MPSVNVRKEYYDELVRNDIPVTKFVNRAVAEKIEKELEE